MYIKVYFDDKNKEPDVAYINGRIYKLSYPFVMMCFFNDVFSKYTDAVEKHFLENREKYNWFYEKKGFQKACKIYDISYDIYVHNRLRFTDQGKKKYSA